MSQAELLQILEDLGAGFIGFEEASRRVGILETAPNRYRCGTCQYFKSGECWRPGQPPHAEHPQSVRCGDYVYADPRDMAFPVQPVRTSRMFK